uniref:DUF4371 domain-containing protein n=1 Tax=Lactuca sativa TaxID=4236 RepID=A0A9R1UUX1_LACSA|nr:hypothetical protein LSAT_V11C800435130 [Lactuca sativa]
MVLCLLQKNHTKVNDFFDAVSWLLKIIGSSYKRQDNLRIKQENIVMEALVEGLLYNCALESGTGLNQEVVLEDLGRDNSDRNRKVEAIHILRKDQDIVNSMNQVSSSKKAIQEIRDVGWEPLLGNFTLYCDKHDINIMMDSVVKEVHRLVNNLHHYHVDVFKAVIDMKLQELTITLMKPTRNYFFA